MGDILFLAMVVICGATLIRLSLLRKQMDCSVNEKRVLLRFAESPANKQTAHVGVEEQMIRSRGVQRQREGPRPVLPERNAWRCPARTNSTENEDRHTAGACCLPASEGAGEGPSAPAGSFRREANG